MWLQRHLSASALSIEAHKLIKFSFYLIVFTGLISFYISRMNTEETTRLFVNFDFYITQLQLSSWVYLNLIKSIRVPEETSSASLKYMWQ